MTINPTKYYKTGFIKVCHPLIEASGYAWLLRQISTKELPAINTSGSAERPRYKVLGADVLKLIENLKNK